MSTIGYESWAVDLANVGAVYPFQGWEVTMTIIGVIFWLGWHRIQFKAETEELDEAARGNDASKVKSFIDGY